MDNIAKFKLAISKKKPVYAVILVGGRGKRLRPLSTDELPKAFLSVTKDRKTMFRRTVERAAKLVGEDNIIVVANKRHAALVKRDFSGLRKENLILENISRNTAPAVTLAAYSLLSRTKDAVMVVMPADHYISDEKKFLTYLRCGIDFVKKRPGVLVAMGKVPEFPATGYGYIKLFESKPVVGFKDLYKVEKFTEKPDLRTAKEYVRSGKLLWNLGIFIFTAETVLNEMRLLAGKIYETLKNRRPAAAAYRALPDISIDYAVMEKTPNMFCVKSSFGWDDMGSFDVLRKVLIREDRRFLAKGGKITEIL